MKIQVKIILLKVLEIIGYADDKESFSEAFLNLCLNKALADYLSSLDKEKKNQLIKEYYLAKTYENKLCCLKTFIDQKSIDNTLFHTARELFMDYLQTITPTLKADQKKKLSSYLTTINIS